MLMLETHTESGFLKVNAIMNLIISNKSFLCEVSEIVYLILRDYTVKRFPVSLVLGIKLNDIPSYEKLCRVQLTIRRMDDLKASIGKI